MGLEKIAYCAQLWKLVDLIIKIKLINYRN